MKFTAEFASGLAVAAHHTQTEKDGAPYRHHLGRVALMVPPPYRQLAWLHDLLEDTDWTADDLLELGAPAPLVADVGRLTRPKLSAHRNPYPDFIEAIIDSGSVPALIVKHADVTDHLRDGYQDVITPSLAGRYHAALDRLRAALAHRQVEVAADVLVRLAVDGGRWPERVVNEPGVARAIRSVIADPEYRREVASDAVRVPGSLDHLTEAEAVLAANDREHL